MPKKRRFQLWFPFTPDLIGVREEEIPLVHNRPLAEILREISETTNWDCEQVYFTEALKSYTFEKDLLYRFYPLSFRKRSASRAAARQWSIQALINTFLDPPEALAIFSAYGLFSMTLAQVARLRRVPYFIIVGGWFNRITKREYRYFDKAKYVLVHTTLQKDELVRLGYDPKNIQVFPIGVNLDKFKPKIEYRTGKEPDWPKILYVGRLTWGKGAVEAVQAFSVVSQVFPNARLHILGPDNDRQYVRMVEEAIQKYALSNSVLIQGAIDYTEIAMFYKSADVLLFPSFYEGLPQVVLESMACGTPAVILNGIGGTSEVIRHGENGWIIDTPRLAYDIIGILKNPNAIEEAGKNASRMVQSGYGAVKSCEHLITLLESIRGSPLICALLTVLLDLHQARPSTFVYRQSVAGWAWENLTFTVWAKIE
jgi:glycosyltransferase involved in cell wall biosynthesis